MFENILTFGKILNIEVPEGRLKGKYVSVVKDYDNEENILYITHPRISNLFVPIEKDNIVKVRYLDGKMTCSYVADVLEIFTEIDPVIYKITGPKNIEKNERRKHLRIPVPNIKVSFVSEFTPSQSNTAILIDISLGGVCIESSVPLPKDEPLLLNFELPLPRPNYGIKNISQLAVKIVWNSVFNNRFFCGAAIRSFKLRQETYINDFVVELQRANMWDTHVKKIVGSLIE